MKLRPCSAFPCRAVRWDPLHQDQHRKPRLLHSLLSLTFTYSLQKVALGSCQLSFLLQCCQHLWHPNAMRTHRGCLKTGGESLGSYLLEQPSLQKLSFGFYICLSLYENAKRTKSFISDFWVVRLSLTVLFLFLQFVLYTMLSVLFWLVNLMGHQF